MLISCTQLEGADVYNTQDGFSNAVGRVRSNELSLFFGRILEAMQPRLSAWWPRFLRMKMQGLFTSPRTSQAPCFSDVVELWGW